MQHVRAKCLLLLTVQYPINPEYHQNLSATKPLPIISDPHLNLSKSTNIQVSADFATFARILVSTRRDVASIWLWLTLQAPLDVVDLWHWTSFRPWYSPAVTLVPHDCIYRTLYIATLQLITNISYLAARWGCCEGRELWLWVLMHSAQGKNIMEYPGFIGLLFVQSAGHSLTPKPNQPVPRQQLLMAR